MNRSATAKTIQPRDLQREEFLSDVLSGLNATRKRLNPKYFYDDKGSQLFEKITALPEYYITRTETRMMREFSPDIAWHCSDTESVVEFGSGSGMRSDLLLDALPRVRRYLPIDVSEALLASTARAVEAAHPNVKVTPILADFTERMQLPANTPRKKLGYFPGSTIGNFLPDDAVNFLQNARTLLGPGARLLIGVDLAKTADRLERAYDDNAGVTAQFNRNILARINEELNADFDLGQFSHQAFFDNELSRIEMHLVSLENQRVTIDGVHNIEFRAGESIHTENSHKFTIEGFKRLAVDAGWTPVEHWVDDERLFSVHYLVD